MPDQRMIAQHEFDGMSEAAQPWQHPTPARYAVEVESASLRDAVQKFADLLPLRMAEHHERISEEHIDALLGVLMPADPIANARLELEIANARMRADFIRKEPCFTAPQISEMAGHEAKNRSVTASRWKHQGRIFSVPFQRQELYPAFQFADGEPVPQLAGILAALPTGMSEWQKAFWFLTPNGWLGGVAPATSLRDAEAVAAAAAREGQPLG